MVSWPEWPVIRRACGGNDGQRLDSAYKIDSSFGELGAWQRVSHYQDWIDDRLAEVGSSLRLIDDLIRVGGGGRELMLGDRGNDVLRSGGGNDHLEGGSGVDVARFEVDFATVSHAWEADGTLVVVSDESGRHSLVDVEVVRFEDRVVLTQASELSGPWSMALDERLYLDTNPDVAAARGLIGGLEHYERYGAREGRDPNALFDEQG